MGTIRAFLGEVRFHFIVTPIVFFNLLFLCRAIFFRTLELIRSARTISYLAMIRNDLIACMVYVYVVFPLAAYLSHMFPVITPIQPA